MMPVTALISTGGHTSGRKRGCQRIHKSDLGSFSLWLKEEKELKANTINNVISVGTVALRWAAINELIPANPAEGLMTFSGKPAKRGVLSDSEVKKLFALCWPDEHSKIGNMLAMSTGVSVRAR
jgi:site-specific recombinase XerD